MKPNLKTKQQLVKTTFDGQSKPIVTKKQQQKPKVVQQQEFEPLGQSIVGQRQFIYFDNNSSGIKNNSSMQGPALDENVSLVGTTQKVYFANASMLNRQEFQKNKRLQEQANAFKPSQKIIHQPVQNISKKPKFTPLNQNSQPQQEDQNEFLELNTVGKWNKNNKSTVISEEMKKMHNHLENRLTQTKWAKKKPIHHEQTSKTEKNSSIAKNQSTEINTSANNSQTDKVVVNGNSMKVIHTTKPENQVKQGVKEHSGTEHSIHVKKGAEKYMEGMSEQAKQRVSSMTSWKEQPKPQQPQEVDDEGEEQEQEQEEEQESQQQDEEEKESEQQEEQQEQEGQQQGDEEQSSGEQGWDEPQQPEQQQPQQQVKQDPFTVPQPEQQPVVKAKKWGSKLDSNSNVQTIHNKNPSILVEGGNKENDKEEQQDNEDQIEDLTQGEIPNEEVDPQWEKLQQILLRIQKLVN